MKQQTRIPDILTQLQASANQFCAETQGLFCAVTNDYKGEPEPKNLRHSFAKISYPALTVTFTYTAHTTLSLVNSILGCSISFDKSEAAVQIPLPLMTDYCDYNTAAPLYVPLITNAPGMVQAFVCVSGVVRELLPRLLAISYDPEEKEKLLKAYREEFQKIFDVSDPDFVPGLEVYDFFALRFTSAAFMNFLKGDVTRAGKQLNKIKVRTGYEERLLRIWQEPDRYPIPELPNARQNAKSYDRNGVQGGSPKEFLALFLSWLILTPLASIPYLALFFLSMGVEGHGAICLLGPMYNVPFCICLGFLTAIALSYFTRLKFYKLFFRKDYEAYCEMDSIQNGGGADRLMRGFLLVTFTAGLLGSVLLAKWNINFRADGFVDNTEFLSVRGACHSYSEIRHIFYRPDRVNGFGETIDYDSYVILLKNGEEIDLYEFADTADYDPDLLNALEHKGITVIRRQE